MGKCIVEFGADIEARTPSDRTALMWATQRQHLEVVRCLVEHDASIEAKDKDRKAALMWAAANNHLEVVLYLTMAARRLHVQQRSAKIAGKNDD